MFSVPDDLTEAGRSAANAESGPLLAGEAAVEPAVDDAGATAADDAALGAAADVLAAGAAAEALLDEVLLLLDEQPATASTAAMATAPVAKTGRRRRSEVTDPPGSPGRCPAWYAGVRPAGCVRAR
jgi:hypothetical protein